MSMNPAVPKNGPGGTNERAGSRVTRRKNAYSKRTISRLRSRRQPESAILKSATSQCASIWAAPAMRGIKRCN